MIAKRQGGSSFCFYGLGLISDLSPSPIDREDAVVARFNPFGDLIRLEVCSVPVNDGGFEQVPSPRMRAAIGERPQRLSGEFANGSSERLFYCDVSRDLP
jgi:hypothetical protein